MPILNSDAKKSVRKQRNGKIKRKDVKKVNIRILRKKKKTASESGLPHSGTKKKHSGKALYAFPILMIFGILFLGASQSAIPDSIPKNEIENENETVYSSAKAENVTASTAESEYTAKLFGVFPSKTVKSTPSLDKELIPCGDVFGVKFFTKGVVVTSVSEVESAEGIISPAAKAGLKPGDILLSVNGKEINTVDALGECVRQCDGKEITVSFLRDEKQYKAKLSPIKALSDGSYKSGMWVRDSTAGIGTITFYDPENGSFAGLGHGIYDSDTEILLPLLKGAVVDIDLDDIIKGRSGHPGELKGSFGNEKTGSLLCNTPCGVFGVLNHAPNTIRQPMKAAPHSEIVTGPAVILSNVDGNGIKEYDIEIVKIYTGNEETKNFVIEVTDPALLEATGGIVRGMSGSPVLQNGKLIGAVTHVLVSDSHKGYGIFIENMLRSMPETISDAA